MHNIYGLFGCKGFLFVRSRWDHIPGDGLQYMRRVHKTKEGTFLMFGFVYSQRIFERVFLQLGLGATKGFSNMTNINVCTKVNIIISPKCKYFVYQIHLINLCHYNVLE